MSKIKIYELAKELEISSKDVLAFLAEKKMEAKSHMSNLEEEAANIVRKQFSKAVKVEEEKPVEQKPVEEVPKKKNIVHVFRPQNTKNMAGKKVKKPSGMQPEKQKEQHKQEEAYQNKKQSTRDAFMKALGIQEEKPVEPQGRKVEEAKIEEPKGAAPKAEGGRVDSQSPRREEQKPVFTERKPFKKEGEKLFRQEKREGGRFGKQERFEKREGGERHPRGERRDGTPQRPERNLGDRGPRTDRREKSPYFDKDKDSREFSQKRFTDRRNDRKASPDLSAVVEGQKPQRVKGKGKEDYKKKEYRKEEDRQKKGKKQPEVKTPLQKPQPKEQKVEEQIKSIVIPEVLTIKELADKMKIVPSVIVKKLFLKGQIVTVNQEIDYETAEEIALEFEVLCEKEEVVDVIEELLKEEEESEEVMTKRAPVVCVMGHVDHGKTSLLDAIRDTNVIDKEAGGITQHIGAYVVEVHGEKITFLDTPGHEAFTAMRMRGASSTDIAILVVAADDGVMPQTVEAISHAKAAGVEIVVAVNKIDKPSANIDRVKQELSEHELIPEDWGGSTIFVPVSAKTREGLDDLMEMLLLTAEVLELKANANRKARGLVLEAELDKGRGSVATILVQKGTLRVGDSIAAGAAYGKVRAMMDHKGRRVKEAGPSTPVEILGLNDVPNAGEVFVNCENDKEARNFAQTFISQSKVKLLEDTKAKLSLDDLFTQIKEGNLKELGIVIKADVQGSVEAMKQSLLKLSNEEVVVKVIHGGVGAINESDVSLASASNAIIIGFNVRPDAAAKETADREGVDLRLYRVIYNAIEDVEAAMKGMLDPVFEEKILGHAEVRQIFKASGIGTIAGSYILDGTFERDCSVRITRDGEQIFDGALASLKRFKDDVKEVRTGYECGLVFAGFHDVKEEDKVEAYKMVEVPR